MGVPPWELAARPDREYWVNMALIANAAEIESVEAARPKKRNSQAMDPKKK